MTGNLLKRTDHLNNFYETFQYDNFDRLTEYRIFDNTNQNQLSLVEMRYSENGNIEYKSNFGEYSYLDQKPNAVESVLPDNQIVFQFTQTIEYNSFNKLRYITDETGTDEIEAEILYGADGHRRVMYEYVNGVKVKTTYYSGGYEEIVDNTTQETTRLHYISGNEGLTSVYEIDNTNTGMHYFVCKDHLGSITALIDENGVVVEERSYDPWGNPRKPDNWLNYNVPFFSITNRGYTGHEHLLQFGLINMNGRMYDPVLGRMLSPDNYVQDPFFPQNYNRYSYCFNNPLIFTDPSGELAWFVPVIVGAVVGGYAGGWISSDTPAFWKWENKDWKAAGVGAMIGAEVGAGVSAYGFGWATKGTIGWNFFSQGLYSANVNMLSTFARTAFNPDFTGTMIDNVFESGAIGFFSGGIGGVIGGPISNTKGVKSLTKSKFWNLIQGKEYSDVVWTLSNVRKTNTISAMLSGGIDRYLITKRKGEDNALWHGILGSAEGFIASRYFTSRIYNGGFLEGRTISYTGALVSTLAIQGVASVPRLGFYIGTEAVFNYFSRGVYPKGLNTTWSYLDYGLVLSSWWLFRLDAYFNNYPKWYE